MLFESLVKEKRKIWILYYTCIFLAHLHMDECVHLTFLCTVGLEHLSVVHCLRNGISPTVGIIGQAS